MARLPAAIRAIALCEQHQQHPHQAAAVNESQSQWSQQVSKTVTCSTKTDPPPSIQQTYSERRKPNAREWWPWIQAPQSRQATWKRTTCVGHEENVQRTAGESQKELSSPATAQRCRAAHGASGAAWGESTEGARRRTCVTKQMAAAGCTALCRTARHVDDARLTEISTPF